MRQTVRRVGQLHTRVTGTGGAGRGTAVLLHGLLSGVSAWDGVVGEVARSGRASAPRSAVCIDLLGFGRSAWPEGPEHYTLERHVAALLPVLEGLEPGEPLHIVGHSVGGAVALALAAALPAGRVRSLTLLSAPIFESPLDAESHLLWAPGSGFWMRNPLLSRALAAAVSENRAVLDRVLPMFAPSEFPPDVVRDYFRHSWESCDSTMRGCVYSPSLYDDAIGVLRARAALPGGPALAVLHPRNDPTVPSRCGRALAARLGATLLEPDWSEHGFPVTRPRETAAALLRVWAGK